MKFLRHVRHLKGSLVRFEFFHMMSQSSNHNSFHRAGSKRKSKINVGAVIDGSIGQVFELNNKLIGQEDGGDARTVFILYFRTIVS